MKDRVDRLIKEGFNDFKTKQSTLETLNTTPKPRLSVEEQETRKEFVQFFRVVVTNKKKRDVKLRYAKLVSDLE